jgi:ABC-2 type transport system permease protein
MAATALLMAALFVAARSARTFQNTISYPLYLLGGVFVPVALLPGWLHPISRVVFLSWSTDLMRDCLSVEPLHNYWPRLGIVAGLGLIALVDGYLILSRVIDRARAIGSVGQE